MRPVNKNIEIQNYLSYQTFRDNCLLRDGSIQFIDAKLWTCEFLTSLSEKIALVDIHNNEHFFNSLKSHFLFTNRDLNMLLSDVIIAYEECEKLLIENINSHKLLYLAHTQALPSGDSNLLFWCSNTGDIRPHKKSKSHLIDFIELITSLKKTPLEERKPALFSCVYFEKLIQKMRKSNLKYASSLISNCIFRGYLNDRLTAANQDKLTSSLSGIANIYSKNDVIDSSTICNAINALLPNRNLFFYCEPPNKACSDSGISTNTLLSHEISKGLPLKHYFSESITTAELQSFAWKPQINSKFSFNFEELPELTGTNLGNFFSGYELFQSNSAYFSGNWKTFVEIYLDNYHIDPYHQGLSSLVDVENISWLFFDDGCLHRVPISYSKSENNDTSKYCMFDMRIDLPSKSFEVLWFMFYPNLIVEIFPGVIFVSVLSEINTRKFTCDTHIYFHKKSAEFANLAIEAYFETYQEDAEIFQRIEKGRSYSSSMKLDDPGIIQVPLELGIAHFHKYLQKNLNTTNNII